MTTLKINFFDHHAEIFMGDFRFQVHKVLAEEIQRLQKKLESKNETIEQAWLLLKHRDEEIKLLTHDLDQALRDLHLERARIIALEKRSYRKSS